MEIKMVIIRNILLIIAGIVIAVGSLFWLGLQIRPQSFSLILESTPAYPAITQPLETIPLPTGLPEPVERFYRTVYGEEVPVIETAVIQGRGIMKPFLNIPIPARFVFVHTAGKDYRHYFEATWFGIPLLKVNEGYINGQSFFESPMGSYYDEQNANQGANLALWAEVNWFPALWLTDSRVRWELVDEYTARLYVPFEEKQETFIVRFNPQTNLIDLMEAKRYRDLGQGQPKILWIIRTEPGQPVAGTAIPSACSVIWLDQGTPWAYFNLEELIYNIDVSTYINQRGH
jgi:Family of unknown function (DUF6544)